MASKPTQEQVAGIFKEAFALFDKDCDGIIATDELGAMLRSMGQNPTQTEINRMMEQVDLDRSGTITFNEFVEFMTRHMTDGDTDEELKQAFKYFDRDNDGLLSASELKQAMENIGEYLTDEEITDMIAEADIYGNGDITFDDFSRLMKNL